MSAGTQSGLPDFIGLRRHFEALEPGQRAELRRVAEPDDLSLVTALYRLFPGERPDSRHRRVVFLLPWCGHASEPSDLGRQLVDKHINEVRVLQVARANPPLDLIQFRRLMTHLEPVVDWAMFGPMLWFWGARSKRRLVEDFYLAQFTAPKGGKK
jgi:CRISPR system Cascade subunit CasB